MSSKLNELSLKCVTSNNRHADAYPDLSVFFYDALQLLSLHHKVSPSLEELKEAVSISLFKELTCLQECLLTLYDIDSVTNDLLSEALATAQRILEACLDLESDWGPDKGLGVLGVDKAISRRRSSARALVLDVVQGHDRKAEVLS